MKLTQKQSEKYLEIVRSVNMDAMFDFGVELGEEQERKRLLKIMRVQGIARVVYDLEEGKK